MCIAYLGIFALYHVTNHVIYITLLLKWILQVLIHYAISGTFSYFYFYSGQLKY